MQVSILHQGSCDMVHLHILNPCSFSFIRPINRLARQFYGYLKKTSKESVTRNPAPEQLSPQRLLPGVINGDYEAPQGPWSAAGDACNISQSSVGSGFCIRSSQKVDVFLFAHFAGLVLWRWGRVSAWDLLISNKSDGSTDSPYWVPCWDNRSQEVKASCYAQDYLHGLRSTDKTWSLRSPWIAQSRPPVCTVSPLTN